VTTYNNVKNVKNPNGKLNLKRNSKIWKERKKNTTQYKKKIKLINRQIYPTMIYPNHILRKFEYKFITDLKFKLGFKNKRKRKKENEYIKEKGVLCSIGPPGANPAHS
jgi:hypothetical protein